MCPSGQGALCSIRLSLRWLTTTRPFAMHSQVCFAPSVIRCSPIRARRHSLSQKPGADTLPDLRYPDAWHERPATARSITRTRLAHSGDFRHRPSRRIPHPRARRHRLSAQTLPARHPSQPHRLCPEPSSVACSIPSYTALRPMRNPHTPMDNCARSAHAIALISTADD